MADTALAARPILGDCSSQEKQQLFMEAAAGPSTSTGTALESTSAATAQLVPTAVPLLEAGEGEEASLPTAAPRQEVVTGADMSYLLRSVLL